MLKRFVVVIFILVAGFIQAQEGTTSPYSFYGIGQLKFKGTVENRAMGGISIYSDSIHLSIQNPAGIADLKLVNFTVGASHRYLKMKTDDENQKASTTSLDYLAVGIPMGKIGASFGLIPYSSVGYKLLSKSDDSSTQYTGTGGVNKAFVGLAYSVTPKFNLGVDVNYNFGNIENESFHKQDDVQLGILEMNRSDLLGYSFNFGASYKTMISERLELSTSVSYTPETDFNSENLKELSTILIGPSGEQAVIDFREIDIEDTDFTFPSQLTIGAGIGKENSWFLGAEYTNLKTSNLINRTFDISDVEYKDASKFRVGGFYVPDYKSFGSYWKRAVYRAGIRFEETGINIRGEDINEFGISFGVSLPVGRLFSNINLGFELGKRGTKNQGLVLENFFNTFLSLSLNDKWFEKRYYE
jgi:long-subunit fatty acid transport protein